MRTRECRRSMSKAKYAQRDVISLHRCLSRLQTAFSHGLMCVLVYFVERVGWTLIVSARPLFIPNRGRFIYTSGLDPRHIGVGAIACIYLFEQVGLSTVSLAIYCAGVHVLFRPGEVGLQPCQGLVPRHAQIETCTNMYTQVQSMEENEIGLLLKPCNVHVGLFVKFDVMFTFFA